MFPNGAGVCSASAMALCVCTSFPSCFAQGRFEDRPPTLRTALVQHPIPATHTLEGASFLLSCCPSSFSWQPSETFKGAYSAISNSPSSWEYEQLRFAKKLMFNAPNVPFQLRQQEPCGPHFPFFSTTPSSSWPTPPQFRLQATFAVLKRLRSAVQIVHVFLHFLAIVVGHGWFVKKKHSAFLYLLQVHWGEKLDSGWGSRSSLHTGSCVRVNIWKVIQLFIQYVLPSFVQKSAHLFWCLLINLLRFANIAAGSLVPFCS